MFFGSFGSNLRLSFSFRRFRWHFFIDANVDFMDGIVDCVGFACVEAVIGCNMLSCAKPYYLKDKGIYVGCGSCACCARKRASAWALRVIQDIKSCKKRKGRT